MEKKKLIGLGESAKSIGAQILLIEDVEVDYSISLFDLIDEKAPRTDGYYLSQMCRADDKNRNDKGSYNFIAIYWPNEGVGGIENAQDWAKKNNLKAIDTRDLVSICGRNIDIYWDLKFFDIIRLVSTNPVNGKYLVAQIEAESEVMIYLEKEMMGEDFFFVFRLE